MLSEFIRSPKVTVIAQGIGPFSEQIRVVGHATAPQAIPYKDRMTLLDVMIQVGGLSETAAGNRAKIVRWVDGEQKQIRVRIDDLINDGKIEENVLMMPGDILIIPQSFF